MLSLRSIWREMHVLPQGEVSPQPRRCRQTAGPSTRFVFASEDKAFAQDDTAGEPQLFTGRHA
jgi:hypothetical protein